MNHPSPNHRYEFASDNVAGMLPELLDLMHIVNPGACASYGKDPYTLRAKQGLRDFFETDCDVFFVFNGTTANSLLLTAMAKRHQYVLAHEHSHLENDECSAPEFFGAGLKVKTIGGAYAKLDPELVRSRLERGPDVHFSPIGAISLTQSTELGTIYSPDEICAISEPAQKHNVKIHLDGARFFYALAATGKSAAELTWKAGVDAISLGGTKLGMGPSEAVVIFNPEVARDFAYLQKQGSQLASKMRFLSAPWTLILEKALWKSTALHANQMAVKLAAGLKKAAIPLYADPVVNSVFTKMDPIIREKMRSQGWHFYDFQEGTARLMTSWLTTDAMVGDFLNDLNSITKRLDGILPDR